MADEKTTITVLTESDWDALEKALNAPPKPNEALKQLMRGDTGWCGQQTPRAICSQDKDKA